MLNYPKVPQRHIPSLEDIPVKPDDSTTGLTAAISIMLRLFIDRVAG
jgi:hypothetical protein